MNPVLLESGETGSPMADESNTPDMILLDLSSYPEADGLVTLRQLHEKYEHIPVDYAGCRDRTFLKRITPCTQPWRRGFYPETYRSHDAQTHPCKCICLPVNNRLWQNVDDLLRNVPDR